MRHTQYPVVRRAALRVAILAMILLAGHDGILAAQEPGASAPAPAVTPATQKLPPNAHMGLVRFQDQPIPGATVTAVQGDRKLVTSTDNEGAYRFLEMAPGTWRITVSMVGFADATLDITIPSDAPPPTLAITLLPYEVITKDVEIVKAAPAVAAAPGAGGNNRQPAPGAGAQGGQGFQRAAVTQATPPPQQAANAQRRPDPPPDPFGGATDGLVVNGSVNNGAASPFAQLANFGNNRRGGRSLYNYAFGLVAGSSAWDAPAYGQTRQPSYNDLQINGGFGGPLRLPFVRNDRDPQIQLQFSRTADTNANTVNAIVPTLAMRAGDFSGTTDALGRPVTLRDPATGLPFENNQIPVDRISPQAAALLGLYPGPNAVEGIFNYQNPIVNSIRAENVQMQLNQPINNRNSANGRFAIQRSNTNSNTLLDFQNHSRTMGMDAMIGWQRRIGQLFTMRSRYQFIWQESRTTPFFANRQNVSGDAGITGNNQDPINWGPPNLAFSISSIAGLSDMNARRTNIKTHAPAVEMFWNRGRHSVQFGGDARFIHNDVQSQDNPRGTFTFSGYATGYDFADFLLGLPRTSSLAFGNADKRFRATNLAGFVTDDIRVGPSFTVQAGVRWEYESPVVDVFDRLVNLEVADDFSSVRQVLASEAGDEFGRGLVRTDKLGFQPRTAIAWRPVPGSSLVVRAGYGIYRNTNVYQQLANLMSQQPPISRTFNVETSAANPLTLASGFATVPLTAINTFAIDPAFRPGFAQNWQASVQRDLPMSLTVVATYLGVKGHRLMQEFLPNTYAPGAVNPCPTCPVGFVYLTSTGKSTRHSGQVQLRRRLRNGLTAQVQYTLANARDDATAFIGASMSGNVIAQDWRDLDAEWGPSNFDQRHNVTAGFQYTTGVGVAGGTLIDGWRGALFKNWTITSNITSGSGMPFTPVYNIAVPGTATIGSVRAQLTGQPIDADGYYVNPAAFTVPAAGEWGNAGRNSVRGPAQFNMDAGITRTFLVGDRLQMDWRVDGRNILNRVTFSGISTFVGSSQFGLATNANQMRKLTTTIRLRF